MTAIMGTSLLGVSAASYAQETENNGAARPALVITNNPVQSNAPSTLYNRPFRAKETKAEDISGAAYFDPTQTLVTKKTAEIEQDVQNLQIQVGLLSDKLTTIEDINGQMAAEYNASVATISTQLQTGTTPGNPRLVERLITAQNNLEKLALNVADLNSLAVEVANAASMSTFLLEATRATYGLSGAVEEDHARLAQLEDQTNNIMVAIDRLLGTVNDDITRMAAYLSAERSNIRTLSLAVTNGDLYGKSLANRPFSNLRLASLTEDGGITTPGAGTPGAVQGGVLTEARPLVKIRFEQPDVDYEQPVYMAVSEALDRFPQARFELVAVHPAQGNSARVAIESTRSRRNAERVLRSLTQMGLPLDKIDLSYLPSPEAKTNEVHIFIR